MGSLSLVYAEIYDKVYVWVWHTNSKVDITRFEIQSPFWGWKGRRGAGAAEIHEQNSYICISAEKAYHA